MDQMRLLLALVLSFLVFMLWNVFFGQEAQQKPTPQLRQEAQKETKGESAAPAAAPSPATIPLAESGTASKPAKPSRQITVETPLYKAVFSEKGAGINSFILKKFRAAAAADSPLMNLLPDNSTVNGLLVGLSSKGADAFENELSKPALKAIS